MKTHRKRHNDTTIATTSLQSFNASPRPRSRRRKQIRPTRAPSKDGKDAFPPALHFRLTLGTMPMHTNATKTTTTKTKAITAPVITIRRDHNESHVKRYPTNRLSNHLYPHAHAHSQGGHRRRASSLGPASRSRSRSSSPAIRSVDMTRSKSSERERHVQRDRDVVSNDSHLRVDILSVDMARTSSRDRNKPTHLREYVSEF